MITRRSFFSGLAAPAFVRRALERIGWRSEYAYWPPASDAEFALLHKRMNECYAVTRQNMARQLYGFPGAREQTVVTLIDMAEDRRYLTLRESLLERSEHHFQRAAWWRIQGKPDYAMGSLHKAAVAEDRARSLPA